VSKLRERSERPEQLIAKKPARSSRSLLILLAILLAAALVATSRRAIVCPCRDDRCLVLLAGGTRSGAFRCIGVAKT